MLVSGHRLEYSGHLSLPTAVIPLNGGLPEESHRNQPSILDRPLEPGRGPQGYGQSGLSH